MTFIKCLKHEMNGKTFPVTWEYEDEYYFYGRGEVEIPSSPLEVVSEFDWMSDVSNAVYKIVCDTLNHKVDSSLCSNEDGLNIYSVNIPVVNKALELIKYTGFDEVSFEVHPHIWGVFTEAMCKRILKNYNTKLYNKNTYQKHVSDKLCNLDKTYENFPEMLKILSDSYDIEF